MRPVGAIAARLWWEIGLKPRNRPNDGFSCLKQAYRVAASFRLRENQEALCLHIFDFIVL